MANASPAVAPPPSPGPLTPAAAGCRFEISHAPAFAMLRLDLRPGDVVHAEAGAMVARHRAVRMGVRLSASRSAGFFATIGAFFLALARRLFGGETFFVTRFETESPGSVWLAPRMAGAIAHRALDGGTIMLTRGAYLASSGELRVRPRFGGLRTLFAKEGAVLLEVSGRGDLWFNSYGGIHAIDVDGGYVVDTGHLVAYEGDLRLAVRAAGGGIVGLVASGEGLVAELTGRGRIYVQSRNMGALVEWMMPLLPS